MSDDLIKMLQSIQNTQNQARTSELDSLVSSIYSGVTVIPSDMVTKTTVLVTPETWRLLHERIDRDTLKGTMK